MNGRTWLLIFSLILLTGLQFSDNNSTITAPPEIRPPKVEKPEIGQQVLSVFSQKCSECHGPGLSQPEGRFGYVLDLARLAQNPELVIPGEPAESELWILVQRNEMPPPAASAGPLNSSEKELVRRWIAEGAPSASFGQQK